MKVTPLPLPGHKRAGVERRRGVLLLLLDSVVRLIRGVKPVEGVACCCSQVVSGPGSENLTRRLRDLGVCEPGASRLCGTFLGVTRVDVVVDVWGFWTLWPKLRRVRRSAMGRSKFCSIIPDNSRSGGKRKRRFGTRKTAGTRRKIPINLAGHLQIMCWQAATPRPTLGWDGSFRGYLFTWLGGTSQSGLPTRPLNL